MDFLMVIIASGFAYGHVRTTAYNGSGVMQDGGHTPANLQLDRCMDNLGFLSPSLILDCITHECNKNHKCNTNYKMSYKLTINVIILTKTINVITFNHKCNKSTNHKFNKI